MLLDAPDALSGGYSVRVSSAVNASYDLNLVSTDTNGRWFVDDVEPGSWELTFRREGYLEEKRTAAASESGFLIVTA